MKLFNSTSSPIMAGVLCLFMAACQQPAKQITITNPLDTVRPDELVVLKRADLEKKLGSIAAGKYVTLKKATGAPLVIQFDDINGDGKWDEAAFLYTFKPNEQLQLEPAVVGAPATIKAVVRAHVRQMRKNSDNSFGNAIDKDTMPVHAQPTDFSKQALPPYLTEGPAWENDKVGFRIYFDVRNGKDIWGKTTPAMMMDEVGRDTSKNYHKQADWGMDILKVGTSLGAGSLALQVPLQNGKDTLVRLGGNNIKQVTYQKIADGPVRAIFSMKYTDWKVADNLPPVTVTETISIWGGAYCYESNVSVSNAPSGSKLVTGIVNLHSKQVHEIDTAGYKSIYTYDVQSENNDKLGMAIIMPGNRNVVTGVTPNANTDVQNTYTIAAPVQNNQSIVFRFYAGWERSEEQFTSEDGFRKYITGEMLKWAKPISD
jgi:hypothetical protein